MRFGVKTQVAAGFVGLMLLAGLSTGCAKKSSADEAMASRIETAASRAEQAANKAEQAANRASDAAQRAQDAAAKAEAIFQKHMRK